MTIGSASRATTLRVSVDVYLGSSEVPVGALTFIKDGSREFSQFAYAEQWLSSSEYFDVSPDLLRQTGYQLRKPATKHDSCFFLALADTEPDAWGRRVIARAHVKARSKNASISPLSEIDFLTAVDDMSRIGALRLRDKQRHYLGGDQKNSRTTPVFLELEKILRASRAVELSTETAEDLAYLQGKGTSLGGMRPKCTIQDKDDILSLGKFPSVSDERSVTRGEVLAMRLAQTAGIDSAKSRVVMVNDQPVAMIQRFDRTPSQNRIPYISGATLLQANRNDQHSYVEIVDAMRSKCENFTLDARQLWRRLVFNHFITNVDDHLQNVGFLYAGRNLWRLAPAFDLNPFPDKTPESKTWLSEDTGPINSIEQLMDQAIRFQLSQSEASSIVIQVEAAVRKWKDLAMTPEVGFSPRDIRDFEAAFRSSGRL